jgi:hypothetical protein
LKIVCENPNATFSVLRDLDRMLMNYTTTFMLPTRNSTSAQGSSREMFQALNQISNNATYDIESDYASGDVGNYRISLMKHRGSNIIHAMAYVNDSDHILNQFIKDNAGKT